MQTLLKNIFTKKEVGDEFHLGAAITMIILIITFISTSFYIAFTSFV
ncbi:MAG: hypothetical protein H0V30_12555 [Chitinophagaceae bacterium]|nr:hypothetical protein [Chitinophagaceae bacterium]